MQFDLSKITWQATVRNGKISGVLEAKISGDSETAQFIRELTSMGVDSDLMSNTVMIAGDDLSKLLQDDGVREDIASKIGKKITKPEAPELKGRPKPTSEYRPDWQGGGSGGGGKRYR